MTKITRWALARVIAAATLHTTAFADGMAPFYRLPTQIPVHTGPVDNNPGGGGDSNPDHGGNSSPLSLSLTNAIPDWATVGDNFTSSLVINQRRR